MLVLHFRMLAGRYHATPWGAHVNEGLVEWPPSPWRLARAMIAVGFSRLGWFDVPVVARTLVEKLASELPAFFLPRSQAAHTRHYMPLYDNKTTKVIDAFAHVGGELAVAWNVELTEEESRLIRELVTSMPYLGRSESWVEGKVADAIPVGLQRCAASDTCPGPGLERVALLAPESAATYQRWRETTVERERGAQLEAVVAKAMATGKKPPKTLSARQLESVESLCPAHLIDALRVETRWLREQGWTQPPGSRWVSYWRPVGALRTASTPNRSTHSIASPTTALLTLASDTKNGEALPPLRDALWRMEAVHEALVQLSARHGGTPAEVFVGKYNGVPLTGHRHATLLPLTLDRRDGRIDHILVQAPMGLDAQARSALGALSRTWAKDLPTLFVTLAGIGEVEDFTHVVPQLARASTWVSHTPFVPPRFVKPRGKNCVEGQIHAELEARGLPAPTNIELVDRSEEFRWFRRARKNVLRAPPTRLGIGIRLTFAEPVAGPISLGYASHFGLGSLVPEGDEGRGLHGSA